MEDKIYLICKRNDLVLKIPNYRPFFNLCGWDVFSIPQIHYDIFKNYELKFFEITKDEANAFKSFGDARAVIKLSLQDDEEFDNTYENSGKVPVEVTETRYNNIIKMMKLFSKILLEEEFNRRYKKLNYDGCELEIRTWETQINEMKKYENGQTSEEDLPLLTRLSNLYQVSLSEMVNIIKNAKEKHDSKVNDLYFKMLEIKNKFKNANSIIDLNLLYIEYFNISTPFTKEYRLQRPDLFNEKGDYIHSLGVGYNF